MWSQAVNFVVSCVNAVLTWFHALIAAIQMPEGVLLGFFAISAIFSLIIVPIRGKALGSDLVKVRSKSADGGSKNG